MGCLWSKSSNRSGGLGQVGVDEVMDIEEVTLVERLRHTKEDTLDVDGWGLERLSSEVFTLDRVKHMRIQNNHLLEIDPAIGSLRLVETVNASGNGLSDLPPEFVKLTRLQTLCLSNNLFASMGETLPRMVYLQELELKHNHLTVLPHEIGLMSYLRVLDVSDNKVRPRAPRRRPTP